MSRLEHALRLAERGFYVFPVAPDGKLPAIKDWVNRATREPEQISKWWSNRDYNIGISTTRFGDDKALCVVDVDTKEGKDGERSLLELELQGRELPVTLEQATPSGGRHLVYLADTPLRQGVDVLGRGLDIRSRGGFILGPGSEIGGRKYAQINGHGHLAAAPGWLVDRLGAAPERHASSTVALAGVDADRAQARARDWLMNHAPLARQGDGGDITTYKVAAQLKDFGLTEEDAFGLMLDTWNEANEPPWNADELAGKVAHAFRYGKDQPGIAAPEAVFAAAEPPAPSEGDEQHPAEALNREFAFIKRGAFILQETHDEEGRFTTERMSPADMHAWFANKMMQVGDKKVPLSKMWMSRPTRREYDAVVFQPGRTSDSRFYNLWRGFSYEPKAGGHKALDAFLEHAKVNVCGGNEGLFRWLMGWFAHLVQHPDEKPLVATVFRGAKGTGKNALVERVGALLGEHFMVADDDRYLLGNFNSHLESNLFFVLDEAAWAGDKRAEGRLKGLITGTKHTIERKGQEPYRSRNLTRVAIIGNEEWLVPASQDERRFAVFTVGNGRRQDRKFFTDMRVGMERGGYSHLLHYLLNFDLSTADVNEAPKTEGLVDQKIASLEPPEQWWLDCLTHGYIAGGDMGGEWPGLIPTNRLRDAYLRWAKNRNIRGWLLEERGFGRRIKKLIPGATRKRTGASQMGDATWSYILPTLDAARAAMDALVDGTIDWENDE